MPRATLTVDLGAIARNWRRLAALAPGAECAAVVKADAYGLGAAQVAPALARAGARTFFVALAEEGAALRAILGPGPAIHILNGFAAAEAALFDGADLRPVLNAPEQVADWLAAAPDRPCALHLDSGMNRLGLSAGELAAAPLDRLRLTLAMTHLACSDTPADPMNAAQLAAFAAMTAAPGLAGVPRSAAATGGILLGPDGHHDLVRPGVGLFGGLPFAAAEPVVTLDAPVLQVRAVAPGQPVGYGAAWRAARPSRVAIVATGYADGIFRAAAPAARAFFGPAALPFAGRVSMDLIALDATDAPELSAGDRVQLLNRDWRVDDLAAAAGTIGYEVLTSLGTRYARRYERD
jgi:alanine racemase